jgi:hypothetical protein
MRGKFCWLATPGAVAILGSVVTSSARHPLRLFAPFLVNFCGQYSPILPKKLAKNGIKNPLWLSCGSRDDTT